MSTNIIFIITIWGAVIGYASGMFYKVKKKELLNDMASVAMEASYYCIVNKYPDMVRVCYVYNKLLPMNKGILRVRKALLFSMVDVSYKEVRKIMVGELYGKNDKSI